MGKQVGIKVIDLIVLREKNYKREIKLLNMLLFIRSTVWKVIFTSFTIDFVELAYFCIYYRRCLGKKQTN